MKHRMLALRPVALLLAALGVLCASASLAQEAERTLTVTGEGEVKALPDEAHLSAGVVSEARKAADALAANARAMNEVFAALRRLGVPDQSIETSDFTVTPQTTTDRNGNESRISGYQVSNEVVVTVDEPKKVGPALDALVASGANSLGNISFTIRDPKPLLDEARAKAVKDAVARAQTYAQAAGLTLGALLAISEAGSEMPRPLAGIPMRMAAAAPTPIASGEESVSATVNVTFAIR